MRGIVIIVFVAALAYGADSYWYHGVYFSAVREMLSQLFPPLRYLPQPTGPHT
jgi:hypothetical protein